MNGFKIWEPSYVKFILTNGLLVLGIFFCMCRETKAITYYISPDGSNSNSGTSTSIPWKTFDYAISKLQPGDTLVLKDGTYTKSTTGLLNISCKKNARRGMPTRPITIKTEKERQAFLSSDGSVPALHIQNCSHWNIEGIRAKSADNNSVSGGAVGFAVVWVRKSDNINLRRLLVTHNNRYYNNHLIAADSSSDILIEEAEAYYHHRHAIIAWKSDRVTVRRSYVGQRGWNGIPGGYAPNSKGHESISMYGSNDGIIENCIAEGGLGIEVHGTDSKGKRNKILGNILLDVHTGFKADSRGETADKLAEDNEFINNVVIRSKGHLGGAFINESGVNTLFQNITSLDSKKAGMADVKKTGSHTADCKNIKSNTGKKCSFKLVNGLIINSTTYPVRQEESQVWLINYTNIVGDRFTNYLPLKSVPDNTGNIRNSMSIIPTRIGLGTNQCIVYVPETSNMKRAGKGGDDIGANIVYRYINGQLTNEKLWNQSTGQFPCGATIKGVNDDATFPDSSCVNVHKRLNVGVNGCPIP